MAENKMTYDNIYTIAERKELIAESLKLQREIHRLTQKQVAERLDINPQTYATYERGRNEPPAEILVRLAFLYDIPVDFLVQKDNMSKDKYSAKKQIDEFNAVIDEMRGKILSGDSDMREQLQLFTDTLKGLTDIMRKFEDTEE